MLFLASDPLLDAAISNGSPEGAAGLFAGLFAIFAAMLVLFLIVGIGLYIYMSLAFSAIGRKANVSSPGLAWIPGIGPLIIAYKASKMSFWPWWLLIGSFIIALLSFIPIIGIVLAILASVGLFVFAVYAIIWHWKMFEAVGKPGWWILLGFIPIFGGIILLILIGIAAWSKNQ